MRSSSRIAQRGVGLVEAGLSVGEGDEETVEADTLELASDAAPATLAVLLDREWVGAQTAHHRRTSWRAIDDVSAEVPVVSSQCLVAPLMSLS